MAAQSAAHLHGHRHSKQRLVSVTDARTQLMLTHPPMRQVCTCVQRIVESCGIWKQLCLNICLHNASDIAPLDNESLEHLQVNRPKNSRPKTGNHLAQPYPPFLTRAQPNEVPTSQFCMISATKKIIAVKRNKTVLIVCALPHSFHHKLLWQAPTLQTEAPLSRAIFAFTTFCQEACSATIT